MGEFLYKVFNFYEQCTDTSAIVFGKLEVKADGTITVPHTSHSAYNFKFHKIF